MASPAAQSPGYPVLDVSFNAGGDCSSGASGSGPNGSFQYCAAKATANDLEVSPSSSAGTRVMGVFQNAPAASQAANVRMLGVTKLVVDGAAGAIAPGDQLGSDASARGIKVTSGEIFAVALQNSTAQNDIISAFVTPTNRY